MNSKKSPYRPAIVLLLLWSIVTSFNVTKAVHIDDTAYLEIAKHIMEDPLHPMSGQLSWDSVATEPIYKTDQPHLMFYLYASTMHVFGESEIALHLLLSLFSLCAIFFFYLLIKQIDPHNSLIITTIFCLGPVFIPSQNLMVDIPMAATWLVFFWLLFDNKRQTTLHYILAAFVCSVAFLIKYPSLVLIPILLLCILFRKKWHLAWIVCIPLLVLIGWSYFNYIDFGGIHILNRPTPPLTLSVLFFSLTKWLICLGAISPFTIILFQRKHHSMTRFWGLLFIVVFIVSGFYFLFFFSRDETFFNILLRILFLSNGVLLFASILFYCVKGLFNSQIIFKSNEKERFLILVLWFLGSSVFFIAFSSFIAVRHFTVIIPVILLMLGYNVTQKTPKKWLHTAMGISVFLGIVLGVSDWKYADVYRAQAKQIKDSIRTRSDNTIWFVGHWGLQWYAKKVGMKPYDLNTSELQQGDHFIVPLLIDKQQIAENHINSLKIVQNIIINANPATFFRTMSSDPWGGFYASYIKALPWKVSTNPLEEFSVFLVTEKINDFKNIEYEILNEAGFPIAKEEPSFFWGSDFYINLPSNGMIREIATAIKDESLGPHYYRGFMKHQNGSYFPSSLSSFLMIDKSKEKVQFNFKVPKYIDPGKYKLHIIKKGKTFLITDIKINIIRPTYYDFKNMDYKILNAAETPIAKEDASFFWESAFYINFSSNGMIREIANAIKDERLGPHYYRAHMKHQNGSSFLSTTSSLIIKDKSREEVLFHFKVPKNTDPGEYNLHIILKGKSQLITNIKINIIGPKS